MRRAALLVLALAACSKKEAPRAHDAAPVAKAPPDAAPVAKAPPDAAPAQPAVLDEEAKKYLDTLASSGEPVSMGDRKPGADLNAQLASADAGATAEAAVAKPRVGVEVVALDTDSETASIVAKKIQSVYQAGLARCARDNPFRGGFSLVIAVNATGHVGETELRGGDEVGACAEKQAKNWLFKDLPYDEAELEVQIRIADP